MARRLDLDPSDLAGLAFELKAESSVFFFDLDAAAFGDVLVSLGIKRTTVGVGAADLAAEPPATDRLFGRSWTMTGLRLAASDDAAAAFLDRWLADLALVSDGVIAFLAFEITSGGTLGPKSPSIELRF